MNKENRLEYEGCIITQKADDCFEIYSMHNGPLGSCDTLERAKIRAKYAREWIAYITQPMREAIESLGL